MYTTYCKYLLLSIIFYLTTSNLTVEQDKQHEVLCKSATIRSVKDFNYLKNCTVIIGNMRIVHMYITDTLQKQIEPSNIEEITGYLLVYRVEGLYSLEKLFPKLTIIRGVELLYDQYSLAIIENRELQNIGLISLLRVIRGSIRIESNPALCFTNTIDWISILGNSTKKYSHIMKNNKPDMQCPLCYTSKDETESKQAYRQKRCWSLGKTQRYMADYKNENKCNETEKANSNCLTSCSDNNCRRCTNYVSGSKCLDNCLPPKFNVAYGRQCVSDCNQLGLKSVGSQCVEKCPRHYRDVRENGKIICTIDCAGNFTVNAIEDLEGFSDCTIIKGSLTIELFDTNKPIIENLEEAFKNVNEITGYLKVLRSPQIVSLNFFKKLQTIGGIELIENKYSLYVVDNRHLEELWTNTQVAILHGRVYFHFNPRLCFDKITDLRKNLKESPLITVVDASHNSNGERMMCGDSLTSISANVTDFNSVSALIIREAFDYGDLGALVGFIYYYREAPQGNVTKYDGRHGCGRDGWFMEITLSKLRRYIIKGLKPDTRYAYFIKSITAINSGYQIDFVSEIRYFRTKPDVPGPVAKLYIYHKSMHEIEVFWWPPRQPNGIIDKYVLQFEQSNDTAKFSDTNANPSKREDLCQCPKLDSVLSGATPNELDYVRLEQGNYINSLTNYMYTKQRRTNTTTIKNTRDTNESTNSTVDEFDYLMKLFEAHQRKAEAQQDLQQELFVINHPLPICNATDPDLQHQHENNCVPVQYYPDSYEIPGHRHSFTLTKLQPAIRYRISVRACTRNVSNGCGPEKVILAQTVSQSLKSVLDGFKIYKL